MTINYAELATTEYGNVLTREYFIDYTIHPLFSGMERIAGPAFTVQGASGDNLALHAALYEAPVGSIIVMDCVDSNNAVAGGNVCKIAQQRGIKGFVLNGVVRDLAEIIELGFPVYAKGVFPVPGKKRHFSPLGLPVHCGGVRVETGDIIVADIEGIAVIPQHKSEVIYHQAKALFDIETNMSFDDWEIAHQAKVKKALLAASCK